MKFGTEYVDTSSYSLYIIALSVLFQCFLFIGGSALADHGGNYKLLIKQHIIYFIKSYNNDFFFISANRKKFLLFYSYTGAIATGLFSLLLKAGDQSGMHNY